MARKNSPALFEVIRAAQQKQQEQLERQQQQKLNAELHAQSPAAALLRSPLYWFKGKQAHETEHGVVTAEPPAAKTSAKPAAPKAGPVMRQTPRTPAAPQAAQPSTHQSVAPAAKSVAKPVAQPFAQQPIAPILSETPVAEPRFEAPIESPVQEPVLPHQTVDSQDFTTSVTVQPPVEFIPEDANDGTVSDHEAEAHDVENYDSADHEPHSHAAQTQEFTEPAFEATVEPQQYIAPTYSTYAPAPQSAAARAAQQVRDEIAAQDAPAAEPMFEPVSYNSRPANLSPFGLDEDDSDAPRQKTFTLNFNFTTAVVAGFAILVAVVVGVIISSAGKSETQLANAKSNVRPDVLDVKPTQNTANTAVAPTPAPAREVETRASIAQPNESLALETLGKPIPEPTNVKRVVGYQYMVLLSFPREEDAKKLVKFLAQNGVPATAEKALPDYAKSWTSVVTTRGFDHTKNNPAFDNYSTAIKDLLQKYAGSSKFRKTFKIDVYTWRKAG